MEPSSRPTTVDNTKIPLREFFTLWLEKLEALDDERDRRYEDRFRSQEIAVAAALAAQKESTSSAFLASEKAIVKAENAQTIYNTGHNDLARKMDDQYKEMLPRSEAEARFMAQSVRLEEFKAAFDGAIADLRDYRARQMGGQYQMREERNQSNWIVGTILGGLGTLAGVTATAMAVALRH